MTLQRPLFQQAAGGDTPFSYAAVATRQMYDVAYATEGVVNLGLQVTQRGAGANMSVDVAAGSCVITGDDVAGQGKYMCVNDAGALNVVVPAAPVSGTRIHRVVARIKDKLHNGAWTTYEWTVELLADTGSGTPALPASALNLARVTVIAGQVTVVNANITDDRVSALLAPSRRLQVASAAGRPPNPVVSEEIYRTDVLYGEAWNGTIWAPTTGQLPKARISRSTNQSITSGTNTTLTLATTDYGTTPTLVAGNTLAPTIPGIYVAYLHVNWASGQTGYYQCRILDANGLTLVGSSANLASAAIGPLTSCTAPPINVTPGILGTNAAIFSANVFQNTGSAVNVTSAFFALTFVGPYL